MELIRARIGKVPTVRRARLQWSRPRLMAAIMSVRPELSAAAVAATARAHAAHMATIRMIAAFGRILTTVHVNQTDSLPLIGKSWIERAENTNYSYLCHANNTDFEIAWRYGLGISKYQDISANMTGFYWAILG